MIIEPNNRLPTGGPLNSGSKPAVNVEDATNRQKQSSKTDQTPNVGLDSVNLSPEARALERLEAQIHQTPELDDEKIASIKKAIADGNFQINVERR